MGGWVLGGSGVPLSVLLCLPLSLSVSLCLFLSLSVSFHHIRVFSTADGRLDGWVGPGWWWCSIVFFLGFVFVFVLSLSLSVSLYLSVSLQQIGVFSTADGWVGPGWWWCSIVFLRAITKD